MPKVIKFSKILAHPDKNLIIRMLSRGDGIRKVANTLKELHPDNKKLWIDCATLQEFRRVKLNLEGETLLQIKKETTQHVAEKQEKQVDSKLNKLRVFKEAVREAANLHVDIRKELQELLLMVKTRVEDLFDRAAEGTLTINEEANLQKYFTSWTTTIQQWAKYVDKIADRTCETTININVIEDQMAALRGAVKEVIEEEMDQDTAIKFMQKLSQKIAELSYRPKKHESLTTIYDNTLKLSEKVQDIEETDD